MISRKNELRCHLSSNDNKQHGTRFVLHIVKCQYVVMCRVINKGSRPLNLCTFGWSSNHRHNTLLIWPDNKGLSRSRRTHTTPTKHETVLLPTAGLAGPRRSSRVLPNPLPRQFQSLCTPVLDFLVTPHRPLVWPILPRHALAISLTDLHPGLYHLPGSTDLQCLGYSKSKIGIVPCQLLDHWCPNFKLIKKIGNKWSFHTRHTSTLMPGFIHGTLSLVRALPNCSALALNCSASYCC